MCLLFNLKQNEMTNGYINLT